MKPFVKWAGGKRKLLKEIEQRLPKELHEWDNFTYIEPFVGGGAVLFHMLNNHSNIDRVIINDINETLMEAYQIIRDDPSELITTLKYIENEYLSLSSIIEKSKYYYKQRDLYNSDNCSKLEKVSLFLFLNRTCFNGLYRENNDGKFNVPHGKYSSLIICLEQDLWDAHKALQNVEIHTGNFNKLDLDINCKHAFFYLDPPYKPASATSSMFTAYDRSGFNDSNLMELKNMCDQIHANNWKFMMSNSDSITTDGKPYFDIEFGEYNVNRIIVTRQINQYNSSNNKPSEVIITNY